MEQYRTEEEQVEALRRWWDENGRSTVIGIVIALAAAFGWQGWKSFQADEAAAASDKYQAFMRSMGGTDEASILTAQQLAQDIKSDYASTTYAQFAALHLARIAVTTGDLAGAEKELRWVVAKADKNSDIGTIAQIRLARVLASAGDSEQALAILDAIGDSYEGIRSLARGDILLAAGDAEGARLAYAGAQAFASLAGTELPTLQAKLQSVSPVTPGAESVRVMPEVGEVSAAPAVDNTAQGE